MAGYPLPPVEPSGGWKNQAQWIGNVEYWSEEMMKLGFDLDTIKGIYTKHIGEPYPRNLANSFLAKNWLFPGADMLYTYDLDNHKKKLNQYTSNEGTKGPGEWENMDPSEIAAVNQYYGWRNDPAHEWMIKATVNSSGPEGNPYQAWLAQWGDRFKDPNYNADPNDPGNTQFKAADIHGRGSSPPPVKPTTPVTNPDGGDTPPPDNTSSSSTGVTSKNSSTDKSYGDPFGESYKTDLNYSRLSSGLNNSANSLGTAFGSGLTGPNTNFSRNIPGSMGQGWGDMNTARKRFVTQ